MDIGVFDGLTSIRSVVYPDVERIYSELSLDFFAHVRHELPDSLLVLSFQFVEALHVHSGNDKCVTLRDWE